MKRIIKFKQTEGPEVMKLELRVSNTQEYLKGHKWSRQVFLQDSRMMIRWIISSL